MGNTQWLNTREAVRLANAANWDRYVGQETIDGSNEKYFARVHEVAGEEKGRFDLEIERRSLPQTGSFPRNLFAMSISYDFGSGDLDPVEIYGGEYRDGEGSTDDLLKPALGRARSKYAMFNTARKRAAVEAARGFLRGLEGDSDE
jgi:hypothetical protein